MSGLPKQSGKGVDIIIGPRWLPLADARSATIRSADRALQRYENRRESCLPHRRRYRAQLTASLPELAVLASASVVTTVIDCFLILFRPTADTQALAPWQLVARAIDSVVDFRIDLVLYCPVFCKAASHSFAP
jgi:hypothetical protein